MIYICNFHVLSDLLLIYICKLHWNRRFNPQDDIQFPDERMISTSVWEGNVTNIDSVVSPVKKRTKAPRGVLDS